MPPDRVFLIYDQRLPDGRHAISLLLAARFTIFYAPYSNQTERLWAAIAAQDYAAERGFLLTGAFDPTDWVDFTSQTPLQE